MPHIPSPQPSFFIDTNPVIIGGGPCGATLALLLERRGIPVTLVDSAPDFTNADYSRSYSFRLNLRAISALSMLPNLLKRLTEEAVPTNHGKVLFHTTQGKVMNMSRNITIRGHPDLYLLRTPFIEACRSLAEGTPLITTMYGSSLEAIRFHHDGQMELTVQGKEGNTKLLTRLLLACDGVNSTTAKLVQEQLRVRSCIPYHADNGLGRKQFVGTSTANLLQSICIDKSYFSKNADSEPLRSFSQQEDVWHWILGNSNGLAKEESSLLSCVPVSRRYIDKLGGQLATVCATKHTGFWDLRSVEEGFELFEKRFPQLDVRNNISEEAMQAFINSRPTCSPCFSRMDSFTVTLGDSQSGGIAYLGDAARSVSPVTGEGVNASLLDLKLFVEALDANAESGSLRSLLEAYERKASIEADAILTLGMQMAEELKRMKSGSLVYLGKSIMRAGLGKIAPGHLYKSTLALLKSATLYSDVLQNTHSVAAAESYILALVGIILAGISWAFWIA